METDPDLVLSCEGIHRFLGQDENAVHVLKDVSLQLHTQRVYSIMGPSGCGKSTLLYLLGLLDRPDSGTLWIAGQEVSGLDDRDLSEFRNQEIGFVFQFHFLLKEFTALENVQLPMQRAGRLSQAEMDERGSYLLELVGLGNKIHRSANHLSGGEQQRVAIARALANDPKVLLMDEPFGALDAQTRSIMQEMLVTLWQQTPKTILFITHDIDEALFMSDRVYVMTARPGRIKVMLDVRLPRPRTLEMTTTPEFIEQKRVILEAIKEETLKTINVASSTA